MKDLISESLKKTMKAESTTDSKTLSRYEEFLKETVDLIPADDLNLLCSNPKLLSACEAEYRAVKERIGGKSIDKERLRKAVASAGVPSRFREASKVDSPAPLWEKAISAESLYLYGPAGTGKTHLACALIREYIESNRPELTFQFFPPYSFWVLKQKPPPEFISVPDLLLRIRSTFGSREGHETESDLIDRFSTKSYMVFDDIGAEKVSEWSLQTLYTIIDRRYRNEHRTTITSNLSLEDLAGKIGDRIASRIAGMCEIVYLKGEDRRLRRRGGAQETKKDPP